MATATRTLPHWDMTAFYPGIDSPEFEQGFAALVRSIDELVELFDAHQIDLRDPGPLDEAGARAFETVLERFNAVLDQTRTVESYIHAFVTTNSRDDLAQAKLSELDQHTVLLSQLGTRFVAWIGILDVEALLERSPAARDHEFMLSKAKVQAAHLMSPAEESLAAELDLVAGEAWGKLYENLTSQLSVPLHVKGEARELPMSIVRNMALEADRDIRRDAYEAELEAWGRAALPVAAAFNSIKGQVNTLAARRRWDSPLDAALFQSNIDRATLDAMHEAVRASFPDFRRYLRAKARALGLDRLAWYDLFAPLTSDSRVWEYDEAADFIVEQFGTYSARMADFAARAFRDNWIDAEPRSGKRDGAFCMGVRGDESRVLSNYTPAFRGLSTLAHELGHGYHNLNLAQRTMLQRNTPMTMAETASIFCETIVREAGLRRSGPEEQLAILEASLQGSCQVVVDITSRFLFEQGAFDDRRRRELSADELNALMLDAQRQTYGDGLDPNQLHEYMWAAKPHYYSSGRSFYNFPYTFGLLFGLGLFARYRQEPEEFKTGYDDLLSSTGQADAATLASRFGIDIKTPEFWYASLDIIRGDIARFEELVAAGVKPGGEGGPMLAP